MADGPVAVVGGGPAGLAAAVELRRRGVREVMVLEREGEAGGIPRHAKHAGFGLRDLRRPLSGPAYARRWVELAREAGVEVLEETMVTGWGEAGGAGVLAGPGGHGPGGVAASGGPSAPRARGPTSSGGRSAGEGPGTLELTSPRGRSTLDPAAVILATGCRERPRSARLVPGSRPAGVMTTGMLQQLVYLRGVPAGRRALVVGAEHVSFSAILTLAHGGADTVALTTELPRHASLAAFRAGARLRYRVPVWTRTQVTAIRGRPRVEEVELTDLDTGTTRAVECDTVVFTADWIPDHELAVMAGLELDPGTRGPAVDPALRSSRPGVFAAGNLLHGAEQADVAALSGRHAAAGVVRHLESGEWPRDRTPIVCEPPLGWMAPNVVAAGEQEIAAPPGAAVAPREAGSRDAPPRARFALRAHEHLRAPRVEIVQGDAVLWSGRLARLMPGRSTRIPHGWTARVDPAGEDVRVRLRGN